MRRRKRNCRASDAECAEAGKGTEKTRNFALISADLSMKAELKEKELVEVGSNRIHSESDSIQSISYIYWIWGRLAMLTGPTFDCTNNCNISCGSTCPVLESSAYRSWANLKNEE